MSSSFMFQFFLFLLLLSCFADEISEPTPGPTPEIGEPTPEPTPELNSSPTPEPTPVPASAPTPDSSFETPSPTPQVTDTPQPQSGGPSRRPHIVIFVVDDLGWANVGYHSHPDAGIQSPTINQLVSEGIALERHYTHYCCSPSRTSLESGRLPVNVNTRNSRTSDRYLGLPLNMTGMAEKMSQTGYKTHFIGKWDMGMATPGHLPINRGYSTSLHYFSHANGYVTHTKDMGCGLPHPVDLWENNKPAAKSYSGIYEENMFRTHAKNLLDAHNASDPFFLVYSTRGAHQSYQVPQTFWDQFDDFGDNDQGGCCMDEHDGTQDESEDEDPQDTISVKKKKSFS